MVSLNDLDGLRPEGIDFEFDGDATSIMPTAQTRRLGMGQPDVPLDWQVLIDGNIAGYVERGQNVILVWKTYELDDGTPAQVTSIDEALEFLGPPKPPRHKHGKHHGNH
jgi:hypothetical protein